MISLYFSIILRILSNPLGNVFQKKLSNQKVNPLWINFVTYFFLALCSLLLSYSTNWGVFSKTFWIFAISGGIMGALGNGFLIQAIKYGEISVLGPINSYKSIIGMLAGIIFLGEFPGIIGFAGMILIIYGSYFIFDTLEEKFSMKLLSRKDIQFRIYATIFTATEAALIKKVITESSPFISFVVWSCFGALFSFLFLFPEKVNIKSEIKKLNTNQLGQYLCLLICIASMQMTTNYVFEKMNVGYALAIFQLSTIVSVVLGYKFFKEKDIGKKLLGSFIMVTGSVLIILYG